MKDYIIYILMGIIILLIVFLILRIVLQMVFIKQCPQCYKTVSLAKSKICPKCGYDFNANKDPKFRLTVTLMVLAILGIGAFDVYSFLQKTEAYEAINPYVNVGSITREDNEEIMSTEENVTEQPVTENSGTEMEQGATSEGENAINTTNQTPENPEVEEPQAEMPQ